MQPSAPRCEHMAQVTIHQVEAPHRACAAFPSLAADRGGCEFSGTVDGRGRSRSGGITIVSKGIVRRHARRLPLAMVNALPSQAEPTAKRHNLPVLHIIVKRKASRQLHALNRLRQLIPIWCRRPAAPAAPAATPPCPPSLDFVGRAAAPRRFNALLAERNPCLPEQWVHCHRLSPQSTT